jgi:hypothetical protein
MATNYQVDTILKVNEIQPNQIEYWEGEEMPKGEALVDYWYNKIVEEFERVPIHPYSYAGRSGFTKNEHGGQNWKPEASTYVQSDHKGSRKGQLRKALKKRISTVNSQSNQTSGYKVFNQINGLHQLVVVDESITAERNAKLEEICKKIMDSPYGLIDPLTGEEAIIDIEIGERIEYYFPEGMNNTDLVKYRVCEPAEAELSLTDTILESQCYGYILGAFSELSEEEKQNSKLASQMFSRLMQQGKNNQVFTYYRTNASFWQNRVKEIVDELQSLSDEELTSLIDSYEVEEPQFIGNEGIVSKTKEINYAKLIGSKLITEDANLSAWIINNSPKAKGVNEGMRFPKSSAGDFIIRITNDPVEILCKSENRLYGSDSCEKLNSSYRSNGPFSDIEYGNGIALIYQTKDVLNEETGDIEFTTEAILKCLGRFMMRWGIGKDASGNDIGVKMGVENSIYGRNIDNETGMTKNPTWKTTVGNGIVKILTEEGLWDYRSCYTPYSYQGYSDVKGGRGNITYSSLAFGMNIDPSNIGGMEDINYADPNAFSFNSLRDLINQTTNDAVLVSIAENPMIWSDRRICSRMMRRLWELENIEDRISLVSMLISHTFSNFNWMIENIKTFDSYFIEASIQDQKNIYQTILNHPMECSLEVYETVFNHYLKLFENTYDEEGEIQVGLGGWELHLIMNQWYAMNSMGRNVGSQMSFGYLPSSYLDLMVKGFIIWCEREREERGESWSSSQFNEKIMVSCFGLMRQKNIGQENADLLFDLVVKQIEQSIENNSMGLSKRTRSLQSFRGVEDITTDGLGYITSTPEEGSPIYTSITPLIYQTIYFPKKYNDIGYNQLWNLSKIQRIDLEHTLRTNRNIIKVLDLLRESNKPNTSATLFLTYVVSCDDADELEALFNYMLSIDDAKLMGKYATAFLCYPQNMKVNDDRFRDRMIPEEVYPILAEIIKEGDALRYVNTFARKIGNLNSPTKIGKFSDNKMSAGKVRNQLPLLIQELNQEMIGLPLSFCWRLISNYADDWFDTTESFYESGDVLTSYFPPLIKFMQNFPKDDDLFYAFESVVLNSQLGSIFTPEGERPYRSLEPEEFDDYDIQTQMSYALPILKKFVGGLAQNSNTPNEMMERIVQKPEQQSVGYKRMLEYLNTGNETFTPNELSSVFSQFDTSLSENQGVKGRLLKYIWNEGYNHDNLKMNPNLVNGRIFDLVSKQYPISILKNNKIPSRTYNTYLNKMINQVITPMPSDSSREAYEVMNKNFRDYMASRSMRESKYPQRFSEFYSNHSDTTQFIRAGRRRWSSGLPSAGEGANERNLSESGSIPDFPQIVQEKPFILFRALQTNVENDERWDGIFNLAVRDILGYGAPFETVNAREITPNINGFYNYIKENDLFLKSYYQNLDDGNVEIGGVSREDYERQNKNYLQLYSYANIYEAKYRPLTVSEEGTANSVAYMLGIENFQVKPNTGITTLGISNETRGPSRNLQSAIWTNFRNPTQKRKFIENLKQCPHMTDFRITNGYNSNTNYFELEFELWDEDKKQEFGIDYDEWIKIFNENLPKIRDGFNHHSEQFITIYNGDTNLEKLWGWNNPDERNLRNYSDDNGFMQAKDSASTFNYDAIYLITPTTAQNYINEEDEDNEVVIETWRLGMSNSDLRAILNAKMKSSKSVAEIINTMNEIKSYAQSNSNTYLVGSNYRGRSNMYDNLNSRNRRIIQCWPNYLYADSSTGGIKSLNNMEDVLDLLYLNSITFVSNTELINRDISREMEKIIFNDDTEISENFIDLALSLSNQTNMDFDEFKAKLEALSKGAYERFNKTYYNNIAFRYGEDEARRRLNDYYEQDRILKYFASQMLLTVYRGYDMYVSNQVEIIGVEELLLAVPLITLSPVSWIQDRNISDNFLDSSKERIEVLRQQYFGLYLEAVEMLRATNEG